MRNRFFVLLFVMFIFVGCNNKQPQQPSGVTPDGTAATSPSLGVPMPTAEILAAVGPENEMPIQRLLPNPLFAVVGKPKQFLASPISTGGEQLVSDMIAQVLQLYHVNPSDIEWFVQTTGFPLFVPAPQDPNAPSQQQKMIPLARRATIITFNKPLDVAAMLRIDDPAALESLKQTEGTTEYYDLTPPNFEGPLRAAFGLFGDKSAIFVEGTADDVKLVFSDTVPKNAVLERLKHTPVNANELTVISSLEGLPISPEDFEKLLDQVGGNISPSILSLIKQNIRAMSLSLNVSAAVGQPIVLICIDGRDEKSAENIRDTLQGFILNMQTTMATMSEEFKMTLPISADLATALLKEMSVDAKGMQAHVTLNNFATLIPTIAENLRSTQAAIEHDRLQQGRMGQLMGLWSLFLKHYQEHQKFPTDILDADGKPLLSWRVALLQSMPGGEELYNKFKLNEPWDSAANLAVLNSPDLRPAIFYPMMEGVDPSKTVIRFFNSPGTPFSKRDLKAEDIKSPENTLMFVVVTPKYAVEWTKPDPLGFDIDNVAEMLGTPQFWGVSFSGQVHGTAVVPNTDPKYDEWKQYVEALVKVLPVETPAPAEPDGEATEE